MGSAEKLQSDQKLRHTSKTPAFSSLWFSVPIRPSHGQCRCLIVCRWRHTTGATWPASAFAAKGYRQAVEQQVYQLLASLDIPKMSDAAPQITATLSKIKTLS